VTRVVDDAARVRALLEQAADLHRRVAAERVDVIVRAAVLLREAVRSGRLVLAFGNGGSAGDAQHLAAEFVGRFQKERRALGAVALSADAAVVTAVANDRGYAETFARQVEALGRPGDVAVGITTSGRSANVNTALARARAGGLKTIGLTGGDGGETGGLVDVHVNVPDASTARVQETHRTILHAICELVEEAL
jgi:D-sedoheptulose 7-phosphate isomerase